MSDPDVGFRSVDQDAVQARRAWGVRGCVGYRIVVSVMVRTMSRFYAFFLPTRVCAGLPAICRLGERWRGGVDCGSSERVPTGMLYFAISL